jgi:site-specific DNA recombinase
LRNYAPNWVDRLTPDGNRPFSDLTVLLEIRVGYDASMTVPPRPLERTAAIYARKSTNQSGVSDEQRSVARQVEHARAYAQRKGWAVSQEHVFVDDGISGAEFANRPGFLRLMNALKPRPAFQVLVMSEESRLGREAIETAYALKQLVQAGVRVFFYLEDRERTLDSPTEKIMLSLTAFADELERERARQRTYDAMQRKARAGHVTGGRVFGYDNIEILDVAGHRSHVERRINEAEAAVVRRIFELCAAGAGLTRITKLLNAEGTAAPRSQQGRPTAWATSSVRAVLRRELYRGELVWNQSRKRDRWGRQRQHARPESEWVRVEVPALQIVPADLWQRAHAELDRRVAQYDRGGRPHRESRYLLAGLARCAVCGGGFAGQTRSHGGARVAFYGCTSYWKRGRAVCANGLVGRTEVIDAEVLATLGDDILRPSVVERAVALALEALQPEANAERQVRLASDLAALDAEHDELMASVRRGGNVELLARLVGRLQAVQARRQTLTTSGPSRPTTARQAVPDALERRIRAKLADWRGLLTRNVKSGREVLKALLVDSLRFSPEVDERGRRYRFTGRIALDQLLAGIVDFPTGGTSPTGFEPVFQP